jgi:hypothetical protein
MHNHLIHASIVALISFFLLALADLIPFWMPMMGEMLTLLVATILLLIWASFVASEKAVDEREIQLKTQSGRVAYLSGIAVLMLALVVQGFAHAIDPWIPVALIVMVLTKFLTRMYLE